MPIALLGHIAAQWEADPAPCALSATMVPLRDRQYASSAWPGLMVGRWALKLALFAPLDIISRQQVIGMLGFTNIGCTDGALSRVLFLGLGSSVIDETQIWAVLKN